jgi:hypothetical protein
MCVNDKSLAHVTNVPFAQTLIYVSHVNEKVNRYTILLIGKSLLFFVVMTH